MGVNRIRGGLLPLLSVGHHKVYMTAQNGPHIPNPTRHSSQTCAHGDGCQSNTRRPAPIAECRPPQSLHDCAERAAHPKPNPAFFTNVRTRGWVSIEYAAACSHC